MSGPEDHRIGEALRAVRQRIESAARMAGRAPGDVRLVAVSKTHGPDLIAAAVAAGQTCFGENRVQEAKAKMPLCSSRLEWHLIGRLQKNKVRQALPLFTLFHGVDSLELAEAMNRICGEDALRARILLEVNVAGESSKFGVAPDAVGKVMEGLLAFDRLEVVGLMGIPPAVQKPEMARPHFAGLRELRDRVETQLGVGLPELSMGMTGDFEIAIAEGATIVRVGTAIFGERTGKTWRPDIARGQDEG